MIGIRTKKYSTLIQHIFEEYNDGIEIFIDGQYYSSSDIPKLLEEWCKNSIIKNTIDFCLKRDGVELFGFHDTPDNFWASMSEQSFIARMAKDKIIRYRIYPEKTKTSILKKLFSFFQK